MNLKQEIQQKWTQLKLKSLGMGAPHSGLRCKILLAVANGIISLMLAKQSLNTQTKGVILLLKMLFKDSCLQGTLSQDLLTHKFNWELMRVIALMCTPLLLFKLPMTDRRRHYFLNKIVVEGTHWIKVWTLSKIIRVQAQLKTQQLLTQWLLKN